MVNLAHDKSAPTSNLTTVQPVKPDEDNVIFANHCVFVWSVYRHGETLFHYSSNDDEGRMWRTAPVLYCQIVLCSIQYSEYVRKTLAYVVEEGFDMFND